MFPSPYGVSFILIKAKKFLQKSSTGFPSPYGVSFILIFKLNKCNSFNK